GSAPSQAAAVVGAYGLTWIVLAISAAPAVWRQSRVPAALALAGLIALYGYGAVRLSGARPAAPDAPVVRIVQADVPQESKYDRAAFAAIVDKYVGLTRRPGRADIVIWPEGAIPAAINDYLTPGAWTRDVIARAFRPGQSLLVGAYRIEGGPGGEVYYNSLVA